VPQHHALPSQTGRAPASARGTRTLRRLVRAARRVFERDGFLEARITDITAEAGVAAGSFYTYFTGKEDAFAAVMAEVNEEMLHPRLVLSAADREDPVRVIDAANRAYLAAYRRNAKLMGLMEQVASVDEEFRALRLHRARAFVERNAQAISRLQQRGLADPDIDPTIAAHAMSAMVSRMAYTKYVQGFGSASSEGLARTLTRLWANALGIGRS
jgi:AcrR family transcriptional regulator